MQKKYEVIRLIKQNAGCHIVMDYVEGEILVFYLKNHPELSKEQFFLWMKQIIRQLDAIKSVKGIKGYGYLTPYCMIVKEDKSIALLDLNAESNASVLKNMEKHVIQNAFFPSEEREDDFYSLGKTIQFLLAHAEITSTLTKSEERKFKKIISKCLTTYKRKSYQRMSDILKEFPKINEKEKKKKKNIRVIIYVFFIFLIEVILLNFFTDMTEERTKDKKVQETAIDDWILFDIGLSYFAELEDYQKSWEFFNRSQKECELSKEYKAVAEFMCGNSENNIREIEKILLKIEEKISKEAELDTRYYKSLLRVYTRMNTKQAYRKIEELSEKILLGKQWQKEEGELRELLASVYVKNEEYEKAIKEYEMLCQWNKSETIYKILIELYDRTKQEEKILEICQKVLEEIPYSENISILYFRALCVSTIVTKEEAEKNMQKVIKRFPELLKSQEFQKLKIECGIKIEGENIWIEK